jgi:putative endonuclease
VRRFVVRCRTIRAWRKQFVSQFSRCADSRYTAHGEIERARRWQESCTVHGMSPPADAPLPSRDPRQQLGLDGERCAAGALLARGYVILARRYRTRFGELDIVARDGDTLVFVEVKTRRGTAFGQPVTWRKRRRLSRLAEAYVAAARLHHVAQRFDVVSVIWQDGSGPVVEVFPNAFDVESR